MLLYMICSFTVSLSIMVMQLRFLCRFGRNSSHVVGSKCSILAEAISIGDKPLNVMYLIAKGSLSVLQLRRSWRAWSNLRNSIILPHFVSPKMRKVLLHIEISENETLNSKSPFFFE